QPYRRLAKGSSATRAMPRPTMARSRRVRSSTRCSIRLLAPSSCSALLAIVRIRRFGGVEQVGLERRAGVGVALGPGGVLAAAATYVGIRCILTAAVAVAA